MTVRLTELLEGGGVKVRCSLEVFVALLEVPALAAGLGVVVVPVVEVPGVRGAVADGVAAEGDVVARGVVWIAGVAPGSAVCGLVVVGRGVAVCGRGSAAVARGVAWVAGVVPGVVVCDRGCAVAGGRGVTRTMGAGACCGAVSCGTCACPLAARKETNPANRREPACRVGVKGRVFLVAIIRRCAVFSEVPTDCTGSCAPSGCGGVHSAHARVRH